MTTQVSSRDSQASPTVFNLGFRVNPNLSLCALAVVLAISGCQKSPESSGENVGPDPRYIANGELPDALPVGKARTDAKNEAPLTVTGYVGGSVEPFVSGVAVFTIVDPSVPYCADEEGCPTPWDYCCHQDGVKTNIATVQFVDAQGKVVQVDARKLLNVAELNLVTVQGTAQRDEAGNLTILAGKIFIKK